MTELDARRLGHLPRGRAIAATGSRVHPAPEQLLRTVDASGMDSHSGLWC